MSPECYFLRHFGGVELPQRGQVCVDRRGLLFKAPSERPKTDLVLHVKWDQSTSLAQFDLKSYRLSEESNQTWVDFLWLMARQVRWFSFRVSYLDSSFAVNNFEYGPIGLGEAVILPDRLLSAGTIMSASQPLLSSDIRLNQFLTRDQKAFDNIISAFALGLSSTDQRLNNLFEGYGRHSNLALKMMRVDHSDVSFTRYSSKRAFHWDPDQDKKILEGGLSNVHDLDLVQGLVAALSTASETSQPVMNRVWGYCLGTRGRRPCNYQRLLVPLEQEQGERGVSIIVATFFPHYSVSIPSAWVEGMA